MLESLEEEVAVFFAVNVEHNSVGGKVFVELIESVLKYSTADVAMKAGG